MTTKKPILLIGLRPELIDFEAVGMPDLSAPQVRAGIAAQQAALAQAGYEYHSALLDLGETAEAQVREALTAREYACVVIGAGLRVPPPHLTLFEKVLNLVHEHAPRSKICFNTSPSDSLDAVRRWALQPADRAASSEQAAALAPRLDSVGEARGGRVEALMAGDAPI
ncbi:MAG: hypothetical protein MUF34_30050 [Polyangiaceae bacterium]|nr:hypothetical protein [Polyangiaceae bacterium]